MGSIPIPRDEYETHALASEYSGSFRVWNIGLATRIWSNQAGNQMGNHVGEVNSISPAILFIKTALSERASWTVTTMISLQLHSRPASVSGWQSCQPTDQRLRRGSSGPKTGPAHWFPAEWGETRQSW